MFLPLCSSNVWCNKLRRRYRSRRARIPQMARGRRVPALDWGHLAGGAAAGGRAGAAGRRGRVLGDVGDATCRGGLHGRRQPRHQAPPPQPREALPLGTNRGRG